MVINADRHELPTDAARLALTGTIPGDAVAGSGELARLLDVDMDEFSGRGALIPEHGLDRLQIAPPVHPVTGQNLPDSGARQAGFLRDPVHGSALPAQPDHLGLKL